MCVPDSGKTTEYTIEKICGQKAFSDDRLDCNPSWADATSVYDAIESGEPYNVTCGIGQTGDFMTS